ncbi:hypothetical protein D3C86_2217900 [compost metagenome]
MTDRTTKAPAAEHTRRVVNGLRESGVLISSAGPLENILKVRPQLVFEREHADLFIESFEAVLRDLQ